MLYIVGTPIGNLEDISYRQAKILCSVSTILAEDTRSAHILLSKIEKLFSFKKIHNQKIVSYYKEKELEKLPFIGKLLRQKIDIALISESGMPAISDPGTLLIHYCRTNSIPYTVVPGPSSITSAITLSGLLIKSWTFIGFLSKKKSDLLRTITVCQNMLSIHKDHVIIAFESPMRFSRTMSLFAQVFPKSYITVCREITKKHEEVFSGSPQQLITKQIKGEIVLFIQLKLR